MIELINVSKYYQAKDSKKYILKNVSLTIPSHKSVAILGGNGAGKSTLLRMLGGIDFPNQGSIKSPNTFSWPMGLSGGFQGSMTGRENVKFVCDIYSKTKQEKKDAIEFVKDFSELGSYFDMPLKTYSSGMKTRINLSLSLIFDFDYYLIDEILSVGDKHFQKKSRKAMMEKIEKSNIIMVSHSMKILKDLCDVGICLKNSEMRYFEDIEEAIACYQD